MLRSIVASVSLCVLSACAAPQSPESGLLINSGALVDPASDIGKMTVSLASTVENDEIWHCTGVVVSPIHVLTAAHCAPNESTTVWFADGETRHAASVTYHGGEGNDLALVRLSEPLSADKKAAPLASTYKNNQFGYAVGAGAHGGSMDLVGQLRYVAQATKEQDPGGGDFRLYVMATNEGDSGGPFFAKRPDGTLEVLGILRSGYGGVSDYKSIPHYRQWIVNAMGFPPAQ